MPPFHPCRVEYEPEDMVKVLPLCKHYAHPECTSEWLKRNKVRAGSQRARQPWPAGHESPCMETVGGSRKEADFQPVWHSSAHVGPL